MGNAASVAGLNSITTSPLTLECYNECDESIFDINGMQSYSMQEIVTKLGVEVEHNERHGETTKYLMKKILRGKDGLEIHTSRSFSVSDLHQFMPIVNFVKEDMQPDLCIVRNGHAVLFAEEDSHQCTNTERCIRKACLYANFHCRYLATHNLESPGYCIHFPSAHSRAKDTKSFAAIISCTWSYDKFSFVYSAQPLDLNNLQQPIVDVVNYITGLTFQNRRDVATLYYLFKLNLSKVNSTSFLSSQGWTCTSQCLSGNSIVLKVTDGGQQQVHKFVNYSVAGNLHQRKQQDSTSCPHLLHFDTFLEGPNSKLSVFTYKVCNPPLTEVEAKECLCNFSHLLISALQAVHEVGIEHCDIRLENICFHPTDNRIVFIDHDRAVNRRNILEQNGFRRGAFLMYANSCMFSNLRVPSVDFVQLGYMVLWITHFNETVNNFQFSGNSNYHNMHLFARLGLDNEPEFVKSLIRRGEPNFLGSDRLPSSSQLCDVLQGRH